GFRLEGSWEHRNFFPPEGMLRLRAVAGTKEQLVGVTVRKNNFHGRDRVLTFDLYADTVQRTAYTARTVSFTATFERLTTLIFQKPWTWGVGIELVATDEAEGVLSGLHTQKQPYYIAALPLHAAYDGSDDLLDPTRGFRAALRVSPEVSTLNGHHSAYARVQLDVSAYQPLGGVVLAERTRLGSIPGTAIENIAPSRRFYAGGGGSVRGYGYDLIGPKDVLGQPTGGRSVTEFSLEARVHTGMLGGALSVVPFLDAGTVNESITPSLKGMRFGTGIGLRYKTGFGPIRVDVGTPLNPRKGDSRIAVYVSLGQAF
ncbi:MAG: BamA/TamA family outer membrane protein, partial [Novosphingobium sp.]|nr:BamA/TamA family outer membrane protein [Novosphingobium sp.]